MSQTPVQYHNFAVIVLLCRFCIFLYPQYAAVSSHSSVTRLIMLEAQLVFPPHRLTHTEHAARYDIGALLHSPFIVTLIPTQEEQQCYPSNGSSLDFC